MPVRMMTSIKGRSEAQKEKISLATISAKRNATRISDALQYRAVFQVATMCKST
jgi:hypothetical protein